MTSVCPSHLCFREVSSPCPRDTISSNRSRNPSVVLQGLLSPTWSSQELRQSLTGKNAAQGMKRLTAPVEFKVCFCDRRSMTQHFMCYPSQGETCQTQSRTMKPSDEAPFVSLSKRTSAPRVHTSVNLRKSSEEEEVMSSVVRLFCRR